MAITGLRCGHIRIICYCAISCAVCLVAGPTKIGINAASPDEKIIEQLESVTPVGSPAEDVLKEIHSRAWRHGLVSGIGVAESMSLDRSSTVEAQIGTLRKSPIAQETVSAIWQFDEYRILRRLQIRRYMTEAAPPPTSGEKFRINSKWTDERIRQELLRYTPIGTAFDKIGFSILSHLDYAGGPANPMSWIGKPGTAVVLDILPQGKGRYIDVRVIWVRSGENKLEDIQVQRVQYSPTRKS